MQPDYIIDTMPAFVFHGSKSPIDLGPIIVRLSVTTPGEWKWLDRNGTPIHSRKVTHLHADGSTTIGEPGKPCELASETWESDADDADGSLDPVIRMVTKGGWRFLEFTPADGEFIANARADMLALVGEISRLRALVGEDNA